MVGLTEEELEKLIQKLEQEFPDYYEIAGGKNYRIDHLIRTHRYARKLCREPEIHEKDFDQKVVEIAALFHDIGRAEDIKNGELNPMETKEGHAEKGAEVVSELVSGFLTEKQAEKAEKVIREHHSEPDMTEVKIVKDADNLGYFGALNLWRMIHYSSDKGRTLEEALEYFYNESLDEREERLKKLNFEVSERIAKGRINNITRLMNTIEMEHLGEDI